MIEAIIFDFDGVITESADIKTEAFKELFSEYPEKTRKIIDYHLANEGISRYVKFRYIYEEILGKKLSKDIEGELGKRFSKIVVQKILKSPFVAGAKEFLERNESRYQFFIASGTPEEEIRFIVNRRGLGSYFKKIYGSPRKKVQIINTIIQNNRFAREETVFVGDSYTDRIAAKEAGIVFVERNKNPDSRAKGHGWVIRDLRGLDKVMGKIECLVSKEV